MFWLFKCLPLRHMAFFLFLWTSPVSGLHPSHCLSSGNFLSCRSQLKLEFRINRHMLMLNKCAGARSLQSRPTLPPHRRQPTRLPRPWDSPGKNTGVGCHFLLQCTLGRPKGMGWGGRWEGGSGWGTHVNPWLIRQCMAKTTTIL